MENYRIVESRFGPHLKWIDCDLAGTALDEFQGARQVLVYEESEDNNIPIVIIKFDENNKIVEVQIFKEDLNIKIF